MTKYECRGTFTGNKRSNLNFESNNTLQKKKTRLKRFRWPLDEINIGKCMLRTVNEEKGAK